MHILHVIDTLGLGGAERMLIDLANASVRDGHRVSVCVTRSDVTLAKELDPKIELHALHRKRRLSRSALSLGAWARRRGVDVAHVHLRHTLAMLLVLRALRLFRTPIVFHDHYGTIEVDTRVPLAFRAGHRGISEYVGVYDRLEAWARGAGMPAERTTTIANALDLSRFEGAARVDLRGELGLTERTLLGLCVATIRPDKSIDMLVDAVARSRHRESVHIAIAGAVGDPAYADLCRQRVRDLGLTETITFLGGRSDVPGLLRDVDFGLMASHTESGPLVLIEYLAAKLPIVATEVGEIGRRLAKRRLPGFVAARDTDAFSRELDALAALSATERHARGEIGHRILAADWDVRTVMPRWYGVYDKAIAHPA